MQFPNKVFFVFILITLLIVKASSQFHQDVDSLNIRFEEDSTEVKQLKNDLYHSLHRSDEKVYQSEEDFLSVIDATRVMQTRTPGLHVNANAFTPGASSSTILRGYRSFLGNNEPLIILDGIPIDNSEWDNNNFGVDQSNRLIDINPNDIESIEIIKSSAGRAKYGIVGGNGVVFINTKKGIHSKPIINVRTSVTVDRLSAIPALQNTYAQGNQFDGERIYNGPESGQRFSWGPLLSNLEYDGDKDYVFDQNGSLVPIGFGNAQRANVYDPIDFFQNGLSNNINVNIKGGVDKFQYYSSFGYNNQEGVIPKNKYSRFNGFGNLHYTPHKKVSIHGMVSITTSNSERSQKGSNLQGIMLGLLRTPPSFDNSNNSSDPVNDPSAYELGPASQRSYRAGIYDNPYWSINKNKHLDNVRRSILNIKISYRPMDNLGLRFSVGNDQFFDNRNGGNDKNLGNFGSNQGFAFENKSEYSAYNLESHLDYDIELFEKFKLNSSLGINYNTIKRTYDNKTAQNLIVSNDLSLSNGIDLTTFYEENDLKRLGTSLILHGNLDRYLHLDASVRYDDSNKFGANINGYLSYGFGIGLELMEVLNKNNSTKNSSLLLHTSIGKFGNQPTSGFTATTFTPTTMIGGDGFIINLPVDGPELSFDAVNNNLKAETTNTFDIGIDFHSEDEKYQFGILLYKENSTGLLSEKMVASTSGTSSIIQNLGVIENRGIELSIGATLINSKNSKWNASLAFSKNSNIVKVTNGTDDIIPLNGFTNSHTAVITDEEFGILVGSKFLTNENDQLIIDNEGFPFSQGDQIVGNPNPDWNMFINNNFSINENIYITTDIDIKSGGDLWCGTCGVLNYFGRSELAASEVGQSLFFEGVTQSGQPNTIEAQLAPSTGNSREFYRQRYGFGGLTEMSIFDSSWIRLRTIAMEYNISDLLNINAITNFTIGVFAKNLILITNYPGIDPETSLAGNSSTKGIDYFNNPGSCQFGFMVNLSF